MLDFDKHRVQLPAVSSVVLLSSEKSFRAVCVRRDRTNSMIEASLPLPLAAAWSWRDGEPG